MLTKLSCTHTNKESKKGLKHYAQLNNIHFDPVWWVKLSNSYTIRRKYHSGYYSLLSDKVITNYFVRQIGLDLNRTRPHEKDEKQSPGSYLQTIGQILNNYAKRNPFIGYLQGFNFIVEYIY